MDLKSFKETFDVILKSYVDQKIYQAKVLLDDKRLNSYVEYIQNFLFSWWKRIRPYCMWLMYKWLGGKSDEESMKFAVAFELFHSMALIHDDIIDQAEKRHNIPTMHKYIAWRFSSENNHIGEGEAILVGDLLLSRVYEHINKSYDFPQNLLSQARNNLHNMIEDVILGQMIDVDMMAGDLASYELIEKKSYYKTASYTFIRPMTIWAILADADQTNKDLVKELGKYLWLAFQLRDDMMDITFGDPTKSPFSDIQEGQQTYFTNYIFTKGTEEQKETLRNAMGKRLTSEQITDLQNMFHQSGALELWQKRLQEYAKKAAETLEKFSFKQDLAKQWFTMLIQKIANV